MDASKKRKGAPASTPSSSEGGASKKLRLLNSNHGAASAAAAPTLVQERGDRLLHQLRKAADKTGRPIATQFLELPPRDDLPDYYDVIRLPVALETIEQKLRHHAYPSMSALESDFKRMVQNAKEYNAPKSDVYEDAERIRKLVYNFMKVNNPQYAADPTYSAVPTPLPPANGTHDRTHTAADRASKVSEPPPPPTSGRVTSVAPSATTGDGDDGEGDEDGGDGEDAGGVRGASGDLDFTGKSFQDAQQAVIRYLLEYTDEEGLQIYSPFGNLPTRKLEDYYKVIRHPVSLKSIAKRCKGQHGRHEVTGVTDFKTWDQFEEEASFIWRNAQEYNEDGSDMYNLADEFKDHFHSLLAEAKQKVDEPAAMRIRLAGPKPKVTLNLSQHRNSPTPGAAVDNDPLLRQKQPVAASVNGEHARPTSPANGTARSASQVPAATTELRRLSVAPPGSPLPSAVKSEKLPSQSPALNNVAPAVQPPSNGIMPPPSVRPSSGSPYPAPPPVGSYTFTTPGLLPPVATRTAPVEQALLPAVTVSTHPQLAIPKRFSISIAPHPTLAQQSTTITLPSTHYFLQIAPTVSKPLSMGRPYKLFVTVDGTRLNQRDTHFHADSGKRTHVYEGSLSQGVNRIEIEVAASRPDDRAERGLDVEKVTVYVNLLRP